MSEQEQAAAEAQAKPAAGAVAVETGVSGADGVVWVPVRCPKCGSRNCPAYSRRTRALRYHECRECGERFKSVEG